MASNFHHLFINLLTPTFVLLLLLSLPNAVNSVPATEIESMLGVLRARGYSLFCNAITVSDVLYDIHQGSNFTFFAPTDSSLFALDMTNTASDYTSTLRYHVVPQRLSLNDLKRFQAETFLLPTLLNNRLVLVERRQSQECDAVTVDGVAVVVPDLFYGRNIAVHGLGGILSLRSQIALRQFSSPVNPQPPTTPNISGDGISESPGLDHQSARPPAAEFTGKLNFSSPPLDRVHAPTPAPNFSGSLSSPSQAPANLSDFNSAEPLPSGVGNMNLSVVSSMVPETTGTSPAVSPATDGYSLAYDLWPNITFDPNWDSRTETPAPAPTEADNLVAPSPPPASDSFEDYHEELKARELLDDTEEGEPRIETPEYSGPSDEKTVVECPVTGGETALEL